MQLKSLDDITTTYRHIFLSPHFDDVVYSCGGTLGVQVSVGLHPLVVTIFAGIPDNSTTVGPLTSQVLRGMGFRPEDVRKSVLARRQEDVRALDYLHTDYLWLDYPDAIFRGNPSFYTQESQLIGGEVYPSDLSIDRQLAERLVALYDRLPDAVWYAPLGVGRHVDHQIVTSAVDRLIQLGANVKLYEDFPYVLQKGALEARLKEFGNSLEPALVEMSEMLPVRLEAAEMYVSQIAPNFGDKTAMFQAMENYTHSIRPIETVHLERYWTAR